MVDVAAAAVKLAYAAVGSDQVEPGVAAGRSTRIFIGAGRQSGIRAADLVGAIANEAGISSRELGTIEIADRFSLVEVPQERADEIIAAMKKSTLRGQKVQVRRDRAAN